MLDLTQSVFNLLKDRHFKIVTAESCTGGLIAKSLTDKMGSSAVFDRGYITYSNQSKIDLLGVKTETLAARGAVSKEVAREMAIGALKQSGDLAISVTGIAGPDGGSADKPVGLVFIGFVQKNYEPLVFQNNFTGTRDEVRNAAMQAAFQIILDNVK